MAAGNRVGAVCAEDCAGGEGGGRRSGGGVLEVLGAVLTLLSAAFIPLTGWMCAQVIQEYERAVIFRLGRVVKGPAKGPGLFWFIPWLDVIRKVDLRTVSFNIQPQEVLTADGVPLKVDAVVFYRVVDPSLWVMRVKNGYEATHTLAQTTLTATLGAHTLKDVLTQRAGITKRMEEVLYAASRLWGVRVERVELKGLMVPVSLQRSMASEAEAARRARAKEEGASLSSVHLIGVSLGAHLAGFVGANLKGKIGRITGLDPAGPMFTSATPEERLDPSDAMFVDVLHTDMNSFGLRGAHGHIDFYANGGADQPGCPKTIFAGKSYFVCDHQRSVFLYLCALNRTCSLTGYPCTSYSDFLDGRCLQCEAFKPASCPVLGYDLSQWRESLLLLGQTKVFFSTTDSLPSAGESSTSGCTVAETSRRPE